jgi:3-methyladenine DNA glycosylase AlkD
MAKRPTSGPVPDPTATAAAIVEELRGIGSEHDREGMARFGITVDDAFGVSVVTLRELAKPYRGDHALALALWDTGNHEARLMAAFVDDPLQVTRDQAETWALGFDSWDLTDQVTTSLLDLTPLAWDLAAEWADRPEEYVRRGGFALMAGLAVHDKTSDDARFVTLLPVIERRADDGRNYVKKAVSWALRNIGKRNLVLNGEAVRSARRISASAGDGRDPESRAERWVAGDVLRELTSPKVLARLRARQAADA